ncbi:MAG: hypothetical protein WB973_01960 [Thermoanaerobaculia bacterium]
MAKGKPLLDIDAAIARVSDFLDGLHSRGMSLAWKDDAILMAARSPKVLVLTDTERESFYRCLTALAKAASHRPIAEATLRTSFENVIFSVFDQEPVTDFEAHRDEQLKVLRTLLNQRAVRHLVAFRVQWIESKGLPFLYRTIWFLQPRAKEVSDTLEIPESAAAARATIDDFVSGLNEGMGIAVVTVEACDSESARELALGRLNAVLDELTGFTAILHPQSTPILVAVFTSLNVSLTSIDVVPAQEGAEAHVPIPLPWDIVRPAGLFATLRNNSVPAGRIDSIVGASPANEVIERILACARYIGRAQKCAFEHRAEDAFLYHVVAIESLLGKQDPLDSIGYQLRMRVAHLLGRTIDDRKEIEGDIVRLYKVRSRLVHAGDRAVAPLDLTQARGYAIRCLFTMLHRAPVNAFAKFAEMEAWFREKLLAGNDACGVQTSPADTQ